MPVPQIAAKIPEVVETFPQEHISDDLPVPQVMEGPAMKQETVKGMGETPGIIIVSTRSKASLRVNECNSGPPSRLRMCLNFGKAQSMR